MSRWPKAGEWLVEKHNNKKKPKKKNPTAAELLPEPPIKRLIVPLLMTEELKPLINSAEM